MSHKVEAITENDSEALADLFSNAGPYVTARTLSDYWLYARLFSTTCLCVRSDAGQPVAAVIAFRDQTPGRNEIYIQDVAVHPDQRGQGLAESLLREIQSRATEWSLSRVWLTSEGENVGAMMLWSKLGYINKQSDYRDGDVWVTRDLKGPGRNRAVFEIELL